MTSYLVRRLLLGLLTLTAITFIVYGLIRNMPGTAISVNSEMIDPSKKINPADLERIRKLYGLDKPWYQAYFQWIGNVVIHQDLGESISRREKVTAVIGERIGPTLLLSVSSLVLSFSLSIPLGLFMAARGGTTGERFTSIALFMLYSFPAFVAALLLQIVFAVKAQGSFWQLPLSGIVSDNFDSLSFAGQVLDVLRHMILPLTVMTYGGLAYESRFINANMQEVLRQDYIRTARAKGVAPRQILTRHAFRNTLIPLVTSLGLALPGLLGGAVILEQIFNWPGMGQLFFEALRERDYPTIMGLILMFSVLTLIGQLLADILYSVVDPRVTVK